MKFKNSDNESDNEDKDFETEIKIKDNEIFFYSDINKQSTLELRFAMKDLIKQHKIMAIKMDIDPVPIKLHICSDGGEVGAAMVIIDLIRGSDVPIWTIVEGEAMSAATLISISGHKRLMTQNAHMLIHQIRGGIWGKMNEFEDEYKNMKKYTKVLKKLYKQFTKLNDEKLACILKKDILWGSKTCLKYGLVDDII